MLAMTRDVVIVGGGIAGLSAAWRLRHRDVLLLEAGDRLGGRMRSDPCGDYWLNYGAHLFPAPGSLVDRMARECEPRDRAGHGRDDGPRRRLHDPRAAAASRRIRSACRCRCASGSRSPRRALKVQLAVRRYHAADEPLRVRERPHLRRLPRPAPARGARDLLLRRPSRDGRARRARRGRRDRAVRARVGGQGLADRAQPARWDRAAAGGDRTRARRARPHRQPRRRGPARRRRAGRVLRRRGDPRAARDHGRAGAARRAARRARWPSAPPTRSRSSPTARS